MTHAHPGDPVCTGTWAITGNPCRHSPVAGLEVCAAHHPDGDKRRAPVAEEIRCTAATKESGERCRRMRVVGGKVCTVHGGSASQVKRAASKRIAVKKAEVLVATYGLPLETTPEQAILDEVHRTAGHVAWLAQRVRELSADDLIWGTTKVKTGGDDRGTTEEAAAHAWVKLYQAERAHLAKVAADAIRVGIEERQVKLAEQQGALIVDLIKGILADLKLSPEQKALIPIVVPQRLRALQATAATN